jgi:hypothetical protein
MCKIKWYSEHFAYFCQGRQHFIKGKTLWKGSLDCFSHPATRCCSIPNGTSCPDCTHKSFSPEFPNRKAIGPNPVKSNDVKTEGLETILKNQVGMVGPNCSKTDHQKIVSYVATLSVKGSCTRPRPDRCALTLLSPRHLWCALVSRNSKYFENAREW